MEERLDGDMVAQSWLNMFPDGSLMNSVSGTSDHSPILIATENSYYVFKKCKFQFGNAWLVETELNEIVKGTWYACDTNFLLDRLYKCIKQLDV